MTITLKGCPPSLNALLGRGSRWDYINEKAKWTNAVFYACMASKDKPKKPWERADILIMYFFPTKQRHDPDNYCGKLLLDGLTKARVIKDDSFAHITLHLAGAYDKDAPRTVITIEGRENT